jgi:hypothetical protein
VEFQMLYLLCIELAMFTAAERERGRQRYERQEQMSIGAGGGGGREGAGVNGNQAWGGGMYGANRMVKATRFMATKKS